MDYVYFTSPSDYILGSNKLIMFWSKTDYILLTRQIMFYGKTG